jgi:hypothetical protein
MARLEAYMPHKNSCGCLEKGIVRWMVLHKIFIVYLLVQVMSYYCNADKKSALH